MKICKYGHVKTSDNVDSSNGCRVCARIRVKAWKQLHPDRKRCRGYNVEQTRRSNRKVKDKAREYKAKNGPCKLCGSWERLELDHIDPQSADTRFGIGKSYQRRTYLLFSWKKEDQERELMKCQILCKSCHSKKTRKEQLQRSEPWL